MENILSREKTFFAEQLIYINELSLISLYFYLSSELQNSRWATNNHVLDCYFNEMNLATWLLLS